MVVKRLVIILKKLLFLGENFLFYSRESEVRVRVWVSWSKYERVVKEGGLECFLVFWGLNSDFLGLVIYFFLRIF